MSDLRSKILGVPGQPSPVTAPADRQVLLALGSAQEAVEAAGIALNAAQAALAVAVARVEETSPLAKPETTETMGQEKVPATVCVHDEITIVATMGGMVGLCSDCGHQWELGDD